MKVNSLKIKESVDKVKTLLKTEKKVPNSLKMAIEVLIMLINILANRVMLNSSNSSKAPSTDPNRKKQKKSKSNKKPGGQKGHKGTRLTKFKTPDKIKIIKIKKKNLPKGNYKEVGYAIRQVVDIEIKKIVTEYRAQILEDEKGKKYTAAFPKNISTEVQYGNKLKANSVYMSQFQLLPYNRIQDHFYEQMQIPLSMGSIFNFNKEAYNALEIFDKIAKEKLIKSSRINSDETGININGKRKWLHCASNDLWSYFFPHDKRGSIAMDEIGIIPNFSGILCHDHWKPYYNYKKCLHSLCNAHHLRELERAIEIDHQKWAIQMKNFLIETNKKVINSGGSLSTKKANECRKKYKEILKKGDKESPLPKKIIGKRGRIKKSKSRNLLERFIEYENDVLRFMENPIVPFTNNLGENDLRMIKVQQKISGCFRSMDGAYIFCRIRGFLSTCRKHGMKAADGLKMLFSGKLPAFIDDS